VPTTLVEHKKVRALAELLTDIHGGAEYPLQVRLEATLSALLRVWGRARQVGRRNGRDVIVSPTTTKKLDKFARLDGFSASLEKIGWLYVLKGGKTLVFPGLVRLARTPQEFQRYQCRRQKKIQETAAALRTREQASLN
jgi:hypothetical protein